LSTIVNDDGDYDQHVRELAFDMRSKPKDRTKTEEELALEEKEASEKAERRRQRRMLGQNESDSEEEGTRKGKRKRGASADDLDFEEGSGEWGGLGAGLDQASAPLSEASEDEDAEEVAETSNVVQRIRALYHTSLDTDNKFDLQVCLRVFYHHCDLLTRIMV
jgi:nucleolar protein 14